jgi:uncharacterized OB-fold protein
MPETPRSTSPGPAEIPLAAGLYTWPSASPQLIGSRCTRCREVAFPAQASCPACTSEQVEEILLSRRGELWTWTIQRFPPPPPWIGDPATFAPYGVGYVELPEGIRVEARLTTADPDELRIGRAMELVIDKFAENDAGQALMTFAFAPVGDRTE